MGGSKVEVKADHREEVVQVCAEASELPRGYEDIAQMALRASYKIGKYEERLNRLRDKLKALRERTLRF